MELVLETQRLILRKIEISDTEDMYEMDSDPDVHLYLGNNTAKSIDDTKAVVNTILKKYKEDGIGRYAVVEKASGKFVGWCGLNLVKTEMNGHVNFYDFGYRLKKEAWGKGYATEASLAWIKYGLDEKKLKVIYAYAHVDNTASRKILEKLGFKHINVFNLINLPFDWFELVHK